MDRGARRTMSTGSRRANSKIKIVKVLVAQLCLTLYDAMNCSLSGSYVHGILQARILEWVAMLSSGDLPDPGIKPVSPSLAGGFITTIPPGKPL